MKKYYGWGIIFVLLGLVALAVYKNSTQLRLCKGIKIEYKDNQSFSEAQRENCFLNETEILNLLTNTNKEIIENLSIEEINLNALKEKLIAHKSIAEANLRFNYNDSLIVMITFHRPIARLLTSLHSRKEDKYILENGNFIEAKGCTYRTLILSGTYLPKKTSLNTSIEEEKSLLEFIKKINEEDYFRALISQIDLNSLEEARIFTDFGGYEIVVRNFKDYDRILQKLDIFLSKITKSEGYEKYSSLNIKEPNQIIVTQRVKKND